MTDKNSPVKVLLTDAKPYDREFFDRANREHGFDLHYLESRLSLETIELTQGFNAVCAFVNDRLDSEIADHLVAHGIRLVALRCAGYNNVDLQSFFGRIRVVRVPAYSPHAVAEHTAALLLSLNRKTYRAYARTRDSNFSLSGLMGFDLYGKCAGVVGAGKIGRNVARILRGFGMRVLVHDPGPDQAWAEKAGVELVALDRIYRDADVITLHCPLTPDNRHMINRQSLAAMKEGVIILNTGRGGLIDTAALIEALKSRQVGAAGLDVYEEEDRYFFEDFSTAGLDDDILARLLTFPNVLITAHQAFFTREALGNIAETTLRNIAGAAAGRTLDNEICYHCEAQPCRRKAGAPCFEIP